MEIIPYGDKAVLLQWEQELSKAINNEVISFDHELNLKSVPGITGTIPAYCSLTVKFDPKIITRDKLIDILKELVTGDRKSYEGNLVRIPVVYGGGFGPDLDTVASEKGLSSKEIIEHHTGTEYRVFMIGFLPGFVYLGTLPDPLEVKRLDEPRLRVAAGSVGLAGRQTGIYPSVAPGGWRIIGRTPLSTFEPSKKDPFLLKAGDRIRFYQVDRKSYESHPDQLNINRS